MLSAPISANNLLSLSKLRRILFGCAFFVVYQTRERLELMRSLRDEGKSYREIGEMMDCSVSTVHKYLAKLN